MSSTITTLRHQRNLMAKTWCTDGTLKEYDDAKHFTLQVHPVTDLASLSAVLQMLESQPTCCAIRGTYVGDKLAVVRDPDRQHGKVRRILDLFDDKPSHWVTFDVDKWVPMTCDALADPQGACDEFIATEMPDEFQGIGYRWQLSNSAGHPSRGSELRAHLTFWLSTGVTSAQLKAWAKAKGLAVDISLFSPVQAHYTANPVFEPGVVDPVRTRSGLVAGLCDDAVDLDLSAYPADGGVEGRFSRMAGLTSSDPIVQRLDEMGLLMEQRRDGAFNITCPFASEHTGGGGASSTVYFPPNTGGHVLGQFKCLHAHCDGRSRGLFLAQLGIDGMGDEFEPVADVELADGGVDGGAGHGGSGAGGGGGGAGQGKQVDPQGAKHMVTDLANAYRLRTWYKHKLICASGRWYAWDGQRWRADDTAGNRFANNLSRIIHAEADKWALKPALTDEARKARDGIVMALRNWAKRSEMRNTIDSAVAMLRKMVGVNAETLDADPWALNVLNGTVDLRTGELRAHNPADLITKMCPQTYDRHAKAPVFESTLVRITREEGQDKTPLADFIMRWFGYCATASTREQKFAVHWGGGANGKSTILDLMAEILGDYASTAAPGMLMASSATRHPTEIADLHGRRMVTAHESGENNVMREDFVKQATGGDRMKGRFMRADFFEFSPTHKLQLLTNHKPTIKGQDHGIWRRVMLIPYSARFGSAEDVASGYATHVRDLTVVDRIRGERDAVLTMLVKGAVDWFNNGLNPPDAVLTASGKYQSEQDRVGQFVSEVCEIGANFSEPLTIGVGGLYPEYANWCRESGFTSLARGRFLAELERIVPSITTKDQYEYANGGPRRKILRVHGIRVLPE